jgi:hypothetical protein
MTLPDPGRTIAYFLSLCSKSPSSCYLLLLTSHPTLHATHLAHSCHDLLKTLTQSKAPLTSDLIAKLHKKQQAELESLFSDLALNLDMSRGVKLIPRLLKKQGEYFEYKYPEVQEAWLKGIEGGIRTPKRQVVI